MRRELIFIPAPGVGHLVSIIEFAKLLVSRDEDISVNILLMDLPFDSDLAAFTRTLKKDAPQSVVFIDIPALDEITMTEIMSMPWMSFLASFIDKQQSQVRNVVATIMEQSKTSKQCGFVIDLFCTSMIDVANEFGVPTYTFFTASAAFLSLMSNIENWKDDERQEIYEHKDSEFKIALSGFSNQVPVQILPSMMLTKEGSAHNKAKVRRLKESKAILVNTVRELEAPAIKFLAGDGEPPVIYHVGPIIKFKSRGTTTKDKISEEAIINWLDNQPPLSVVYLCFGSVGSFHVEQVKEIAQALELSGQRFLWSLRRPSQEQKKWEFPKVYEDFNEVLPEGFLDRTSGIGKVIGWTPQVTILSHPSVGGFVSHCGWNSTLESIWCGVPIATWPMFADQQINAFQLVVELGIATEIKMDSQVDIFANIESTPVVRAEEIERGIRYLMGEESELRKKMKEMKDTCRNATVQGGSSYASLAQFIRDVKGNI
ncbi:Glycosyltransferase [Heracleum sosnowskyi]|uniref:Glycosyltransferase n=1 Tax=Heracleum sosnowskyi TaxID=360622 RepID=A0AAD8HDT4_9APIA|nr:Glycosyltransferase [Heracleum sosnowskyi]